MTPEPAIVTIGLSAIALGALAAHWFNTRRVASVIIVVASVAILGASVALLLSRK